MSALFCSDRLDRAARSVCLGLFLVASLPSLSGAQCRVEGLTTPDLEFTVSSDGQVLPSAQTLWLHNDSAWQLAGVPSIDIAGLSITPADSFAIAPGDSLAFELSYEATGCGGAEQVGSLFFGTPCDSIAVSVLGDSYFVAELPTTELAFDVTAVGESDSLTFTVIDQACGDAQLTAQFVPGGLSHPEFTLTPSQFAFGDTVTVIYTPIDAGGEVIGLEIVVDSSTTGGIWISPTTIALKGEGPYAGPSWFVATDGSDSNRGSQAEPFLTLQRAVDAAASGDSVLVFDGVFAGAGNTDIQWSDRSLHFASVSGDRDACVVEAAGSPGFVYADTLVGSTHAQSFSGLTIRNATTAISVAGIPPWQGGSQVSVDLDDMRLVGGTIGLEAAHGSVSLRDCVIREFTQEGVSSSWTNQLAVDACVLRDNGIGLSFGQFFGGALVEVDSTEIVGNGVGLSYYQESFDLRLSDCRVDSSTVGEGIQTNSDSQWCILENTSVIGNAGHGVAIPGSSLFSATDSQIVGNGEYGISGGIALLLDRVDLHDNGGWGVGVWTPSGAAALDRWAPDANARPKLDPSVEVEILDCDVRGNQLGGLDLDRPFFPLRIENTTVVDNLGGPGIRLATGVAGLEPALTGLTLAGNGGVGLVVDDLEVVATRLLIASNQGAAADLLLGAILETSCSNLFDNAGGNWTGNISAQATLNGNFSADPYFVDAAGGDYSVVEVSPCLPGNHPDGATCGLVGILEVGAFAAPQWISLDDVDNDQGRRLRLVWSRSHFDAPGSTVPVTGYGVYRRQVAFPGVGSATPSKLQGWDFLQTVPSRGDDVYQYVAETLCDSTVTAGDCPSVFFISAMTNDPFTFYDSVADSGSSVDNLSPQVPTGFAVDYDFLVGNELTWQPNPESDLRGYRVYRSSAQSAYEFVQEIFQTTWTDSSIGPDFTYRITAVDLSGNESPVAEPNTVTAIAPGEGGVPHRTALVGAYPNPFNPATELHFEIARRSRVELAIYDLAGRRVRRFDIGELAPGPAHVRWNGRDDHGEGVASGVYLVRLKAGSLTDELRIVLVK